MGKSTWEESEGYVAYLQKIDITRKNNVSIRNEKGRVNCMARPTDYRPDCDYVALADAYLSTCGREATKLPKVEEFCRSIGIDSDTGVEWNKLYPNSSFSVAYKKIKEFQRNELIDDGLFGGKEVNPAMAIFLLKVNHGMIEKSNIDFTTGGKPFLTFDMYGEPKALGTHQPSTETEDSTTDAS